MLPGRCVASDGYGTRYRNGGTGIPTVLATMMHSIVVGSLSAWIVRRYTLFMVQVSSPPHVIVAVSANEINE